MSIPDYELVIVGGGPAGMAAAVAAYESGVRSLVILERDDALGGILRQCIHNGLGLHRFGEELTGPEYAARYEAVVEKYGIPVMLGTTVLGINENKEVTATSAEHGIFTIKAKAVVLAMGCRERPRGALGTAGTRPSGVFTAGTAQKFVNMKGYMPGKDVVILGSGDIGLIMARRMTLEGARVHAVCEIMPYSGGLARNIEQCLNDFDIPLLLSHTVVKIHGKERVEGVTIAKVDGFTPIEGTERFIPCDTLLLSCGLIPENELTKGAGISLDSVTGGARVDGGRETDVSGIFACGNVLHVHDLVDYVSAEAVIAGKAAAEHILGGVSKNRTINITTDGKVRYTVPQRLTTSDEATVYFRVGAVYKNKKIVVRDGDRVIYEKKKLKLAPGEMESVTLGAQIISEISGDNITFSIEDAEVRNDG